MTGIPSRSMPMWSARPTLSGVRFGLWAPALEFVDLFIEGEIEPLRLQRDAGTPPSSTKSMSAHFPSNAVRELAPEVIEVV
jgi:hypothetical protein